MEVNREDGNLRVRVSHVVENVGDSNEVLTDACSTSWAGLCQDGTHSPFRQVFKSYALGQLTGLEKGYVELQNDAVPEGHCIQEH
ncbi:hypothetical protein TNCT_31531 [Trichonephila clavata]|uniref:Uncharacterized protein n=1 Tax=Trichonephila clavata TaxID=2740835 RepID=A0A8X6HGT6_TRICU|nr:hypothetical protein TNCT_31531 [Trichonephila clavata]